VKKIAAYTLSIIIFITYGYSQNPQTWHTTGIGGGGALFCPSMNPGNPHEFYVACDMSELFHSTDFGQSYDIVDFRQLTASTHSMVKFTNGTTRYSINYANDMAVPVKSTDNGVTWNTLSGNPDQYEETYSIWADYNNADRVILSYYDEVYFSNNGGTSFTNIHTAENQGAGIIIGGVFFDGDHIYLGTNDGIIYSADGGNTFTTLTTTGIPANERIFSFAVAKQGGKMRFVCLTADVGDIYLGLTGSDYWGFIRGIYSMDNLSGTWTSRISGIDINSDYLMFVAMAENDTSTVYLGGSNSHSMPEVMKTSTAGSSWTWSPVFNTSNNQNINTGWCGDSGDKEWWYPECLYAISVAPNNKDIVLISDMAFVHKTSNGGATWQQVYVSQSDQNPLNAKTPQHHYYHSVGLENTSAWYLYWSDANHVFAAYTDIFGIRSQDNGQSWSFDYSAPTTNTMYHIVKNTGSNTLYAATSSVHDMYKSYRLQDKYIDNGSGSIIFSNDKGATWSTLHDFGAPVYWLATDPHHANRLYAAVVNHSDGIGGVYVTDNINDETAASWTQLPAPPRTEGHPATMTVLNNGYLVCTFSGRRDGDGDFTASSGVFEYNPNTSSWTDKSDTNMYYWCHDLVVDNNDASQNTWYVGVYSGWGGNGNGMGGLYKTTDAGHSWTKVLDNVDVSSCTINPNNPDEMYITTHSYGLWYSNNINNTHPVIKQVDNYKFGVPQRVFFDPFDSKKIWITSFGNGMQWGETTSTGISTKNNCSSNIKIYPNPASTYVQIESKKLIGESIKIIDITGKTIINVVAGKAKQSVDISNLPKGVYFIKVKTQIQEFVKE
jgi:photosystem II stability/assembly factor-like uncharacterized protein